jgi:hypothetical protein
MGRVAGADAARIFTELHIADPVQAVFDAPMSTPPFQQFAGPSLAARYARDGIGHFGRLAALDPARAFQAAHLGQTRPVEMACQARGSLKLPTLASAMSLLNSFRLIEFGLPLSLGSGGKRPPETRRPPLL